MAQDSTVACLETTHSLGVSLQLLFHSLVALARLLSLELQCAIPSDHPATMGCLPYSVITSQ